MFISHYSACNSSSSLVVIMHETHTYERVLINQRLLRESFKIAWLSDVKKAKSSIKKDKQNQKGNEKVTDAGIAF